MENNEKRQYLFNVLKTTPVIVDYSIKTQDNDLNKRNDFFELKNRIDLFLDNGSDARFYIMPGLRGVGKTTILFQLYDYLINTRKINHYEGRSRLAAELAARGIARDVAGKALDEFFTENDEDEICRKAYEKLSKSKSGEKLTAALMRAGFSLKQIKLAQE